MAMARPRGRGCTLLELLMASGLLGMLAIMVLPVVELNAHQDKEREPLRALRELCGHGRQISELRSSLSDQQLISPVAFRPWRRALGLSSMG
jgi:hypothetical protein